MLENPEALAYWISFVLVALLVSGLFVAEAVGFGGWGTAAATVIIVGIVAGWLTRTGATSRRSPHSVRSQMAALSLALPLAFVMLAVATVAALAVLSFVVVPVANYGLPMLIVVASEPALLAS